ncbi:MAG: tetratricopeptide repeat protein [Microcoleaceae cyanobacterium MO_207.B10]|nr:tetratricopeptide repeat protein [Microcoleaceae cyanobacterium MO_207.B10]
MMGTKAEAIEIYKSTRNLTTNTATHQHLMGSIDTCGKSCLEAATAFAEAASLEPDNPAHWHGLGLTQLSLEAPVAALQAFDAVLKINPNDIVALTHSYHALMAIGDFEEAWRRINLSLELYPQNISVLKLVADHRSRQGLVEGEEGKQTKRLILTALRLAPDAADVIESLALYHLNRWEWNQGITVLRKFVESHPSNPSGWYYYAQCLFYTGDFEVAADAILKAYDLYPEHEEIYRALCEILPTAGRLAELRLLMEKMLEQFPQRWNVWVTVGRVLVESFGEVERGCAVAVKAVQLQPQMAEAWFRYGRVLALAGRSREAIATLETGWQWLPATGGYLPSVAASVWLGEIYRAVKDVSKSRHWCHNACDRIQELMDFYPATAYYWQGRALSCLGNISGATQSYQNALSNHLFYPVCLEVEATLQRLQAIV